MSNLKDTLYGYRFTQEIAIDTSKMKHIECQVTLQKNLINTNIIYRVFYGKTERYRGVSLDTAIEVYEKI